VSTHAIHQFVPVVEPGAVAAHTRAARGLIRGAGYRSEIFASEVHPACNGWGVRPFRDYGRAVRAHADDVLVYQMAIGSVVADFLLGRRERLVVNHHNLTPLRYFDGWDPVAAGGVVWGRHQLRALAERAVLGIAVSAYNEHDLVEAGFRETTVAPFLVDPGFATQPPDDAVVTRLRSARERGGTDWLFVGRIAPNKAQHDLIKALAVYRRRHDPGARLHLVGGGVDTTYGRTLRRFADALGLSDAVALPGAVDPAALAAYYTCTDVFVSTSEHEGFCVPLVEAMHHDLPVVAHAAAAIPETLADAGLLLDVKDPYTVATAVSRVLGDERVRAHLVARGRARREQFALDRTGPRFIEALRTAVVP
jgi:glycosyltransferase involved in cell wall biosynthesis